MAEPIISIRHLQKSFGSPKAEVEAIRDVSIDIEKGEIYGIIGLSGAGKSTLANLICRFFEPTEGAILLDGKDLRNRNPQ